MAKSTEQVARSWAAVTIKKWRANLQRERIGSSQALSRSFEAFVEAETGGDLVKIKLMYAYYGKFVDMGVGRGQKIGQKADNTYARKLGGSERSAGKTGRARRAKKWYSKTMAAETFILAQILQAHSGARLSATVTENIAGEITLNL